MSSTNINIGISETKMSSRVLKPPGGGHSDIFGPPDQKPRSARPKNDQQNSSMMCEIMGRKQDPPQENKAPEPAPAPAPAPAEAPEPAKNDTYNPGPPKAAVFEEKKENPSTRGRVPPGGFSSGLW